MATPSMALPSRTQLNGSQNPGKRYFNNDQLVVKLLGRSSSSNNDSLNRRIHFPP